MKTEKALKQLIFDIIHSELRNTVNINIQEKIVNNLYNILTEEGNLKLLK